MALVDEVLATQIEVALKAVRDIPEGTSSDAAIQQIATQLAVAITNQIRTASAVGTATPAGVVTVTNLI